MLSYVLGARTGVLAISSTDLKVYQSIMALPTVHTCNTEVARVYTPPPPGGLPPHKYANPCVLHRCTAAVKGHQDRHDLHPNTNCIHTSTRSRTTASHLSSDSLCSLPPSTSVHVHPARSPVPAHHDVPPYHMLISDINHHTIMGLIALDAGTL